MTDAANISSLDAVRQFAAAILQFQSEARISLSAFETQLNRIMFWLERERPEFWKREIENCMREASEARVRLHQCRMRRVGDFRPSCIEEVKELEKTRRAMHFAQKQIPVVKRWRIEALHEANEFHGRSAQLVQILEREIPRLLSLLHQSIERIETYAGTRGPNPNRSVSGVTQLAAQMAAELQESRDDTSENADTPNADDGSENSENTTSTEPDDPAVSEDSK